ncbi:MAG: SseB family protein [Candidatus Melainabacteria bacterium]
MFDRLRLWFQALTGQKPSTQPPRHESGSAGGTGDRRPAADSAMPGNGLTLPEFDQRVQPLPVSIDNSSAEELLESLARLNALGEQHGMDTRGRDNGLEDKLRIDRYRMSLLLFDQLVQSHVLLPIPQEAIDQQLPREEIPLWVLKNKRDELIVPVFTSERTLQRWKQGGTPYTVYPFRQLCTYVVQHGLDSVMLNLAGPCGMEIRHYELTYLAEGLIPPAEEERSHEITISKNTEIHLAELPVNPAEPSLLFERLSGVFRQRHEIVEEVYAFQVAFSDGPMKTALGIKMPHGAVANWESDLWPDVLAVLQEVLGNKEYVNVFLLNETRELEETLEGLTQPFYKTAG